MFSLIGMVFLILGKENFSLSDALSGGMYIGLFLSFCLGPPIFFGALSVGLFLGDREIRLIDVITWNRKWALKGLGIGLGIGASIGILVSIIIGGQGGLALKLFLGMLFGLLVLGPVLGLLGALFIGIRTGAVSQTTYPGQRIHLSTRNSSIVFIIAGLIVFIYPVLLFVKLFGPDGLDFGIILGSIFGPLSGLIGGSLFGGIAVIKHYSLRFTSAIANVLPWRLVPFLDYCVDRIFLRRVGGGYIFVHRLLMEHFADMYPEASD